MQCHGNVALYPPCVPRQTACRFIVQSNGHLIDPMIYVDDGAKPDTKLNPNSLGAGSSSWLGHSGITE